MTILTMPSSPDFSDTQFGLVSNTQTDLASPLDQTSQVLELPGARWSARYALPPLSFGNAAHKPQIRDWQVFLARLRGRAGQFYGFDPSDHPRTPAGSAGSFTLKVNGGGQAGNSLVIDGADPMAAEVFKKGDHFAFDAGSGRQLVLVTADVSADSSGEISVSFEPPIRTSPADNADIITSEPSCVMRLVNDEVLWESDRHKTVQISFDAIEVFA